MIPVFECLMYMGCLRVACVIGIHYYRQTTNKIDTKSPNLNSKNTYTSSFQASLKVASMSSLKHRQWPLLLLWFNFNPDMDN